MTGTGRVAAVMSVLALLFAASPALAQDANDRDPSSNAPGGDAYDIPLDSGRDDAAPNSSSRRPRSRVHSDQGLGSSTQVPGATATQTTPQPPAKKPRKHRKHRRKKAAPATTPRKPSTARARSSLASAGAGGGGPSGTLAIGLVALAAVVATALAVLGRRAR